MTRGFAVGLLLVAMAVASAQAAPPVDPDAPSRAPATSTACRQVADEDGHRRLNRNCLTALAFDPKTYFGAYVDREDALEAGGLVDAVRFAGLGGPRWGFAIATVCPGDSVDRCAPEQRRPVMRAVTIERASRPPAEWIGRQPQTEAEMRRYLAAVLNWRQADLRSCPGAVRMLLSLEDVPMRPFDDWTRGEITGHLPKDIVITADADTVTVRAGAIGSRVVVRDQGQRGGAGDWAEHMLAVARPCLRPTTVAAPWEAPGR